MESKFVIFLFTAFIIKHFIVDFCLQTEYQWKNKGIFGHPGGILHSGLHAVTTFNIVAIALYFTKVEYRIMFAVIVGVIDFIIHYFVDYAKVNINHHYGWKADNSNAFWVLLGLDQTLHLLTYVLIIWMTVNQL